MLAFEAATRDLVGLALRSVERIDVSLPQFRLLQVLDELGPSSPSRCAGMLGVVASTVTRLADRLHRSGHLIRRDDPTNRSMVELELTDAGREVVRRVTEHRRRELREALGHLDPALRMAATEALEALHRTLGSAASADARRHLPM
ncbi:MarR family transcriptional regulator [Tsukamurella pseudospumae]|uniref:MarR family transcriptional regulator n=1 Tax=Tsukamurella pseudospumae TaxID=239498 RepID=A0A138A1D0_9ACTN|nr:MarR family transcriptional regulator [Tsukamurella pseudospumae]KXP04230.1 MarR family transcriptional regulator [Tsukamurella pseudospumae]